MELVPNCAFVQEQAEQINAWMDMRSKQEQHTAADKSRLESLQERLSEADNHLAALILQQEFEVEGPPSLAQELTLLTHSSYNRALRVAEASTRTAQSKTDKILDLTNAGVELGMRHIEEHIEKYHKHGQEWCHANKHPRPPRGKRIIAAAIHLGVVLREIWDSKNKPTDTAG